MGFNIEAIKQMKLTPGEAAALALFDQVYAQRPDAIKKLIEDNDQTFTGDPNLDLLQVIMLSQDRKQYFNDPMVDMFKADPKYFDLGDFKDKIGNVFDKVKQVSGAGLQTFAPIIGMGVNALAPGAGGLASGLASGVGNFLNPPKTAGSPAPSTPTVSSQQLANTVQQTFSAANAGTNLDNRPAAQDLLNKMETPVKTIMGIKATYFWIGLGVLVALAITITIVMIRRKKKKALAAGK